LIRYLVYTNVFISICAIALTSYSYLLFFGKLPEKNTLGFVFFATLFAYNFHRKVGRSHNPQKINSEKEKWLDGHQRLIYCLIFGSFGLATYYCYNLPKTVLVLIFPLGFLSIFYILEVSRLPSLRSLPFLKIFIISFVWGGVTVLLPLLESTSFEALFGWEGQLFAVVVALFVFAETLPFDVRDVEEDRLDGLKTLPQRIGIKKSKNLSIFIYILSFILFTILIKSDTNQLLFLLSYGLSLIYSIFWILRINTKRHELFYSLAIESTLCMPLVFYCCIAAF